MPLSVLPASIAEEGRCSMETNLSMIRIIFASERDIGGDNGDWIGVSEIGTRFS